MAAATDRPDRFVGHALLQSCRFDEAGGNNPRPGHIGRGFQGCLRFASHVNQSSLSLFYIMSAAVFGAHSWPGNVRELRNVIEGAFVVAEGNYITKDDLPEYLKDKPEKTPGNMTYQEQVKAFERSLLCKALQSAPTKTEAAKLLGMTKQALNYRLDSLGMK